MSKRCLKRYKVVLLRQTNGRSVGRLNLNVLDANAGVGLFVLDSLFVTFSSFLLDNLFQCALCVFGYDGGDFDGGSG